MPDMACNASLTPGPVLPMSNGSAVGAGGLPAAVFLTGAQVGGVGVEKPLERICFPLAVDAFDCYGPILRWWSEGSEPIAAVLCRTIMETGKTMRRAPSSLFAIRSRRSLTTVPLISSFGWQIVDRDGIE